MARQAVCPMLVVLHTICTHLWRSRGYKHIHTCWSGLNAVPVHVLRGQGHPPAGSLPWGPHVLVPHKVGWQAHAWPHVAAPLGNAPRVQRQQRHKGRHLTANIAGCLSLQGRSICINCLPCAVLKGRQYQQGAYGQNFMQEDREVHY